MRLFHLSNEKYSQLEPHVGEHRHVGEDAQAVGKALIWLHNDSEAIKEGSPYRHEVEVADDDPDLVLDSKFDEQQRQYAKISGKPSALRWYFYCKPLPVLSIAEYDTENQCYRVQGGT